VASEERSGVPIPELSPIEERIVLLVAAGQSVAAIAAELGVTARTVEWHLARAGRKLERTATLHDRVQAVDHQRRKP
jgi:DNA-binding NarL/FixJ family response regulator